MENQISKGQRITGWVLTGFVSLFLLFDGVIKFMQPEMVIKTNLELGFQEHHIMLTGFLVLIPTLLYLFPKTSVLGAILLTGYLGGAVAVHVRVDNPLFSHTLFPVYVAIMVWAGLWLRNAKLRQLFPFQA